MATSDLLSTSPTVLGETLPPLDVVFGPSRVMQSVREKMEKLVGTNVPVLIHGESGTGKEVMARMLHRTSPWSEGPFVKVSCPAIPTALMESELFGYEKGAFTGANRKKPGRVEMANCGTLFMDEIAELHLGLQAKLLQVLQDGQFCRIGAKEETHVEARIVCSTNRDLRREIQDGRFRPDLFYRINVVNLHMPPLRERLEDIPGLVEYFFRCFRETFKRSASPLPTRLLNSMYQYSWPGNIRQLENVIKQYVILGSEDAISSVVNGPAIPEETVGMEIVDEPIALKELTQRAVQILERKIILTTLRKHHWNRRAAARALKISYRSLLNKIREARVTQNPPETQDETSITTS